MQLHINNKGKLMHNDEQITAMSTFKFDEMKFNGGTFDIVVFGYHRYTFPIGKRRMTPTRKRYIYFNFSMHFYTTYFENVNILKGNVFKI